MYLFTFVIIIFLTDSINAIPIPDWSEFYRTPVSIEQLTSDYILIEEDTTPLSLGGPYTLSSSTTPAQSTSQTEKATALVSTSISISQTTDNFVTSTTSIKPTKSFEEEEGTYFLPGPPPVRNLTLEEKESLIKHIKMKETGIKIKSKVQELEYFGYDYDRGSVTTELAQEPFPSTTIGLYTTNENETETPISETMITTTIQTNASAATSSSTIGTAFRLSLLLALLLLLL